MSLDPLGERRSHLKYARPNEWPRVARRWNTRLHKMAASCPTGTPGALRGQNRKTRPSGIQIPMTERKRPRLWREGEDARTQAGDVKERTDVKREEKAESENRETGQ
ncbi:hypothetical protein NDU88_004958 [Pleurodeles waltl]|uniref:Uncharacterized protein n=1 Tax=Pleurodeles waltl TaxID=8319 RepID=A0AAV7SKC1_PLEWA|nr:hypothetical protein NDU88_004958 [Pleurodeles waltl]